MIRFHPAIASLASLCVLAVARPALGRQAPRDSDIPTPSEYHGFDIGERYIVTSAVIDYYRMLGERSTRAEYMEYGRSIQGRPLPLLILGNERNLARKEEIQQAYRQLTNTLEPLAPAELERITADLPVLVWIFIVDTDEEAGVNVLQEVAHRLATAEDAETRSIRENVLVIMTPLTNPDAHARYVNWHMLYDVKGAAVDPNAVENRAHWGMNTDGNAYGIDVNRDFGVFVTPEMQALARVATAWRPQFWVDVHSGPNVIFIPPFPRPFHPLWPAAAEKWWMALAERASTNFGLKGWSFNSREGYEGVTSVTFGLSWGMLGPSLSGMLFETFGGRPGKTTAFIRSDGSLATMRMAMDRHDEAIRSLLQVARDHRAEILRDAHRAVVEAVEEARRSPVRGVVFPASGPGVDPDKVSRLVERLTLQGVEVRRASQPFTIAARTAFEAGQVRRSFPAGSYIVDFVQPNARLARALLDPTLDYSEPEVETPFRARMPYYDSSWGNLALVFGVPSYAVAEPVRAPADEITPGTLRASHAPTPALQARASGPPYAYLLPAGREASYRVAIALLQEGYRVRVFRTPFRIGRTTYQKGTFALLRGRNPVGLAERLAELAAEHAATVIEVDGPYTDAGPTFGDEQQLAAIPRPLVAVVADWPVSHDHVFGGIRTTLEADFGFTFSPVMLETINRADLSKYTTVVLPHAGMDVRGGPAFSAGYRGRLDIANLRRYVMGGGTLIVIKGAAEVVARDSVLGRDITIDGWAEYTNGATLRAAWVTAPELPERAVWRPGLAESGLPLLAAGYVAPEFAAPGLYPILLGVRDGGGAQVIARYSPDPANLLLDGYMLHEDRPRLAGRPFVLVQRVGRGRVIYFADDPTFRGYWYGLNQLFLNSLLLGPLL